MLKRISIVIFAIALLPCLMGATGIPSGGGTTLTDSASVASAVSNETGTNLLVFNTSPVLVTPILGTPTSGTLTSCTGLPISTGVSGLGTGVATFLATPSGANFASALTTKQGTGVPVFDTSPTLTTPVLGVASATSVTFGTSGTLVGGANLIEMRNGTGSQLNVLNLNTHWNDASNNTRLRFGADIFGLGANGFSCLVQTAGSLAGANANLYFGTDDTAGSVIVRSGGSSRWTWNSSGHFLASTTNTLDIGAAGGVTCPRSVYVATSFLAPAGSSGTPSISFDGETGTGYYKRSAGVITRVTGGVADWESYDVGGGAIGFRLHASSILGWGATTADSGYDTAFSRVSAGVIGVGTGAAGSVAGAIKTGGFLSAPIVSAAASLTLTTANSTYVASGTTSTWTLPATSGNTGFMIWVKNRGSGTLTIQRAGSDNIYTTSSVTSFTVAAGGSTWLINDGTFWCTQ